MAETTSAAAAAAPVPDPAAIARAERFTLERFVHAGEDPADALAPGTGRRRALDAALRRDRRRAARPSTEWRRRYSLLLGLERAAQRGRAAARRRHDAEPAPGRRALRHADRAAGRGAARRAAATARRHVAAPVLAVDDEPDECSTTDDRGRRGARRSTTTSTTTRTRTTTERGRAEPADFEEVDEAPEDVDEDVAEGAADDPNAAQALLVRARDRRRQDRRRDGLRRGLAHRRRPDPHPPAQPRRPVHRRAARPRLRRPRVAARCSTATGTRPRRRAR